MTCSGKKTAFFCGASRGLGRTIAQVFIEHGWRAVVFDLVVDREEATSNLHFCQCDLSNYAMTEENIHRLATLYGQVDAMVNCVRYREEKRSDVGQATEWKKAIETDVHSYFNASTILCEWMKKQGGSCSLINISSIVSTQVTLKESMSYHVAKAAINQMTKYLAVKYGPHGIRVNSVLPGLISNRISEKSSDDPNASLYAKYARHVPLRRSGAPEEVAEVTLFLASSASFMTGQNIIIDGGLSLCDPLGLIDE